ncbi:zinc-binding dehydrogenase [Amycolatopsis rhabdoformis]|uniref:Zinc-binding dehydrogenase n=1 Tax=Amycolatopsis rhabdoformis TaxID=1448059 RepID=A0ABZ1IKB4_9PSEU|nr:zinc-binding dehydrogenase [Amycolatopsis rhabdoformis]WSE34687.1 zinc-binding dehydrogenase [Amycolatopsis rhabdoformis]
MTTTSRVAVLHGEGRLTIEELPLPRIGANDGLLKIEATGVCGTDIAAYHGVNPYYELPCALGHEFVGRITELGAEAAARWGVSVGDRIVVEEYLPCGTCRSCLAGSYQMCEVPRYGGKSIHSGPGLYGGYADYLYLHPQAIVHKVSEDVPAELVQLYIPIANGLDWVTRIGGMHMGGTVVIVGPGPHGLACLVGAREAGAGTVIMVGTSADETRLAVAKQLGADHTFTDNAVAQIEELTGGLFADVVVNTASSAAGLDTALAVAGDRATVVQAGVAKGAGGGVESIVDAMNRRVLTLRGVRGRPSYLVPPALRLIESGRYPLELLCSGRFPIEDTEKALTAAAGDPTSIRAIVVPELSPNPGA